MPTQQTAVLVKPDGLQRGLIGEIISRFERKGLKLVAMKMVQIMTRCFLSGTSSIKRRASLATSRVLWDLFRLWLWPGKVLMPLEL